LSPLQKRTLRRKRLRQEVQRGADAGGAPEIFMREQPESRSRLRQRLRRETAQPGSRVAEITWEQSKPQSGKRRVTQGRKRIDAAGDVRRMQILAYPTADHRARQRLIRRDPIVSRQVFVLVPGQVSWRSVNRMGNIRDASPHQDFGRLGRRADSDLGLSAG
jgi:hypothetical protein